MSTKLLTLAYKMPLNLTEKSVLAALAFTVNDDGFGFPGYKDLLEKTGIGSKSTLAKTLAILEGAGFFTKTAHAKIGDGRKVNTYQLCFNETWFELIQQEGSKSPRPVLIESIRIGLIEKINKLRDNKKRTISPDLVPRKVHSSPPISTQTVHESSLNRHSESSLHTYREEKPAEKVVKKQSAKPSKKTTIIEDSEAIVSQAKAQYEARPMHLISAASKRLLSIPGEIEREEKTIQDLDRNHGRKVEELRKQGFTEKEIVSISPFPQAEIDTHKDNIVAMKAELNNLEEFLSDQILCNTDLLKNAKLEPYLQHSQQADQA